MKLRLILLAVCGCLLSTSARAADAPVRYAIVGLVHDHARGFIPLAKARQDVQLVAIVEPNQDLARRYAQIYHLDASLFYTNLDEMLDKAKVQAVATFTSTFDHARVVETCAARGVHVMMEKPLAVNMEHARAIQAAAAKGHIQVLVNYETTWYPSNQAAYNLVRGRKLVGDLRKIVVRDGHQGPKEIGCSADFLGWLTDPVLNGGGALTDFGCYGADLITWLMLGRRPTSVLAVTQHIKPQVYPKVEDEATIILTYPEAQGIIQASWNWPFNRKDMDIYGRTGYVLVPDKDHLRVRIDSSNETERAILPLESPNADPLSYLAAVVRGDIRPSGLSSLAMNMIVTEILDAARESARTGKRVDLPVDERASIHPGRPSAKEIAQGATDTYNRFIQDARQQALTMPPDDIPEQYWAPALRALHPVKVYHQSVHVVIVQKEDTAVEEGLYFWSSLSSQGFPKNGRDNFHWTPLIDDTGSGSPLGIVLAYRKHN